MCVNHSRHMAGRLQGSRVCVRAHEGAWPEPCPWASQPAVWCPALNCTARGRLLPGRRWYSRVLYNRPRVSSSCLSSGVELVSDPLRVTDSWFTPRLARPEIIPSFKRGYFLLPLGSKCTGVWRNHFLLQHKRCRKSNRIQGFFIF